MGANIAITMRPWQGASDLLLMAELLCCMPQSTRHLIDLPWRLSSPATWSGRDARVWQHDDGRLVGFATWHECWATLDYIVRPGMYQASVEAAIFDWADERFRELDRERGRPLPYWVDFREDDQERRQVVEAHGFLLEDDHTYIQLQHSLAGPLTEVAIPPEFGIRPLAGAHEADAYVALHRAIFKSSAMTPDWRLRSLHMPRYQPGLDLVAVAPGGELAGFCTGWLDNERYIGQIEPIGVHPRFEHMGLGHALLVEVLRRFKARFASSVLVETASPRSNALTLYTSAGFRPQYTIIRKGKCVTPFV
ncbi:MAG: hypothetical protein NVS2B12_39540 [Ktedonobacteraceae bacterium]